MATTTTNAHDIEMRNTSAESVAAGKGLNYEPPPLVRDVQQGWFGSCQAAAVVAALFASIEAGLITLIKTPPVSGSSLRDSNPGLFHFLLLLSYSALCFNAGATITSLVISDQLGEMPFRSRNIKAKQVPGSAHLLLKDYQVSKRWSWLIAYWYILLFCGGGCFMAQVGVIVWLYESNSVRIVMTPVLALCSASLIMPVFL